MNRIALGAAALAASAIALCGMSTPAGAVAQAPTSRLIISYSAGEFATSPPMSQKTLECDPVGGTHPEAGAACDTLTGINGNFHALKPLPNRSCLLVYQPVVVTVQGNWGTCPVFFSRTYSNHCAAHVESGGVF